MCARGGEKGGGTPPQKISTSDRISHTSDQPSDRESVCTCALAPRAQGTGERAVNISVCEYQGVKHASNSSAHAASATQHHLWEHVTAKFEFGLYVCVLSWHASERCAASPAGARASPRSVRGFWGPPNPPWDLIGRWCVSRIIHPYLFIINSEQPWRGGSCLAAFCVGQRTADQSPKLTLCSAGGTQTRQ